MPELINDHLVPKRKHLFLLLLLPFAIRFDDSSDGEGKAV